MSIFLNSLSFGASLHGTVRQYETAVCRCQVLSQPAEHIKEVLPLLAALTGAAASAINKASSEACLQEAEFQDLHFVRDLK